MAIADTLYERLAVKRDKMLDNRLGSESHCPAVARLPSAEKRALDAASGQ
jgi:hypothetical protein